MEGVETYVRFEQVPRGMEFKMTAHHPCKALVADAYLWNPPVPDRLRWADLEPGVWRGPCFSYDRDYFEFNAEDKIARIAPFADRHEAGLSLDELRDMNDNSNRPWFWSRRVAGLYADVLIAHVLKQRPTLFVEDWLWVRWQGGSPKDAPSQPTLKLAIYCVPWEPVGTRWPADEQRASLVTHTLQKGVYREGHPLNAWQRLGRDG